MSINPVTQYPGKVAPATPDNPFGTARNITIPGDGTGTPWESAIPKDEWALHHAMLLNAGMEPNGTPDSAENSQLFKAAKASIGNGANLLSNHNFLIPSPDDSQPAPSATPTSYPPGYQIFSNVFANETSGISNLTYIDGHVSFSGGDFYIPRANSQELENVTEFVASVADFDGKPRTRGVSFALVGDEYRVTVGVDALEDASATLTPLGSVKLEQGVVATGHDVQSYKGQAYTFSSVADAVANCPSVGSTVVTEDYYGGTDPNGSGVLFFKVVPAGTGIDDGGKYIDVDATRQLEQNLKKRVEAQSYGAVPGGVTDSSTHLASLLKNPRVDITGGVFVCNDVSVSNDVDITGSGTLKLTTGSNTLVFNSVDYSIDGLFFEDYKGASVLDLIRSYDCKYITIKNCTALNLFNRFVWGTLDPSISGDNFVSYTGNKVTCKAAVDDGSISMSGGGAASFLGGYKGEVVGNNIRDIAGTAVYIYPFDDSLTDESQVPDGWVFSHNNISRCKRPSDGEGQTLYYRGHNITVHDNPNLSLCGRNIIDIQGTQSQTIPARGVVIHSNTLLNRDDFMTNTAAALVHLRCCESIVYGNWFYGAGTNNAYDHNGILSKWGGSLSAFGNKFPLKVIDGFEHVIRGNLIECSTSSAINNIGFDDISIDGNTGYLRFSSSALIKVESNSTELINSVTIGGNTGSGSGVLCKLSDLTNNKRIREVSIGPNNIADSSGGIIDSADISVPFKIKPISYGYLSDSALPTSAPLGSEAFAASSGVPVWFYSGNWVKSDGSPV